MKYTESDIQVGKVLHYISYKASGTTPTVKKWRIIDISDHHRCVNDEDIVGTRLEIQLMNYSTKYDSRQFIYMNTIIRKLNEGVNHANRQGGIRLAEGELIPLYEIY